MEAVPSSVPSSMSVHCGKTRPGCPPSMSRSTGMLVVMRCATCRSAAVPGKMNIPAVTLTVAIPKRTFCPAMLMSGGP